MSSPAIFYDNKMSSNLRIYTSTARSGYQAKWNVVICRYFIPKERAKITVLELNVRSCYVLFC
jgi:hypothetical protein